METGTTPDAHWACPSSDGWTFDQAKELELPTDAWELVDGHVVVRGRTKLWHNSVRDDLSSLLEDALPDSPRLMVDQQCVMLDERNVRVPDVIVYDPAGLNFFEADCVPVDRVRLAVEVMSPNSRTTDRLHKPVEYAQANVPYYWRVALERDDRLAVHEYWLNADTHTYIPRPERPVHRDQLVTDNPFPIRIDLSALLDF